MYFSFLSLSTATLSLSMILVYPLKLGNVNRVSRSCKLFSVIGVNGKCVYSQIEHVNSWSRDSNLVDREIRKKFYENRNWNIPISLWKSLNNKENFYDLNKLLVSNETNYSITNLKEIENIGNESEFTFNNTRYQSRKSFALRVGYVGTEYYGYQTQNSKVYKTVEDDIRSVLRLPSYPSGRTDKRVSAISQIVCFNTKRHDTSAEILQLFDNLEACKDGRLTIYECARVPRKFNARASAIWRKYIYIFPLNKISHDSYDVDVDFVNRAVKRLMNLKLPYHAFSRGEDRNMGDGMKDFCIIYYANAKIIELPYEDSNNAVICFELVGNRFLRNMVRLLLSTVIRESIFPESNRNENILVDLCNSTNRQLTEFALPGDGLCLAGVGYDLKDLSFYDNMPRIRRLELENKYSL